MSVTVQSSIARGGSREIYIYLLDLGLDAPSLGVREILIVLGAVDR